MNTNRRTFLLATGMTALASRSALGANQRLRPGHCGGFAEARVRPALHPEIDCKERTIEAVSVS